MTVAQKERKLKIIMLILIVNTEILKRRKFNNPFEILVVAMDSLNWILEYRRLKNTPTYERECNTTAMLHVVQQ